MSDIKTHETPGPYIGELHGNQIFENFDGAGIVCIAQTVDTNDSIELADLLNKGEHFNDLLKALETIREDVIAEAGKVLPSTLLLMQSAINAAHGRSGEVED